MALDKSTVFTLNGPAGAEERIWRDQETVAAAVAAAVPGGELTALILAGGYGRKEGGYRRRDGKYYPLNDYDYFVVVDGSREVCNRVHQVLVTVGHELTEAVGVEVDFYVLRKEDLPGLEYSMMNAELRWGHLVVLGDERVLDAMAPMPVEQLPLEEFSRLLLNRGSLLLLNQVTLSRGPVKGNEEREQFARYIDKAVMACADARLAVAGRYHTSVVEKMKRLEELEWSGKTLFMADFRKAMDSRYGEKPILVEPDTENRALAQGIGHWLTALAALEGARRGSEPRWTRYAMPYWSKGQGRSGLTGWLRNLVVNLRDFGAAECLRNPAWLTRYPRERLLSVLPALLEPSLGVPSARLDRALALRGDTDHQARIRRYLELWARYS